MLKPAALAILVILAIPAAQSSAAAAESQARADALANYEAFDRPAPVADIAFSDGEGRPLSLDDFRGRVVLLNLWATWCAPCVHEMPSLDRLEGLRGGPDFEVVAISLDRQGLDAVNAFFAREKIGNLRIYLDRTMKAVATLGARGLPYSLLIDRDGRAVGRAYGAAEWDSPAALDLVDGLLAGDRREEVQETRLEAPGTATR